VKFKAVRIGKAKKPAKSPPPPAKQKAQPQPQAQQPQPTPPQQIAGQSIDVKVVDPLGNPKPNFFFKLTKQGQPEQAGMTDGEGRIVLTLPAAGPWKLFFPDVDGGQQQGS
jgi:hypothetical protein